MLRLLICFACVLAVLGAATVSRPPVVQARREFWGFTGPWDPASAASLRAFGGRLDATITGWIALDSASARPLLPTPFPDTVRPRVGTTDRMVLVTSWHGDRFHARPIRTLARDPVRLGRTVAAIVAHATAYGYRGLVLDFETMERADRDALIRVVSVFTDSAHRRGIRPVVLAIPATDTSAYPARRLLAVADYLLVMLYDQHWPGSQPGPISDPAWVRRSLALRISEVGPERLIAGLPAYGYRWRRGAQGEPVAYREAQRIAAAARVPLQRDPATSTLRALNRGAWDMWVTDVALLQTLVRQIEAAGVRHFALWRLGQEDPAIWSTLLQQR